jgi:hypothetical protein
MRSRPRATERRPQPEGISKRRRPSSHKGESEGNLEGCCEVFLNQKSKREEQRGRGPKRREGVLAIA